MISEVKKMHKNLILLGMPASGKSTIGKKISKQLNVEFIDTDDLIIQQTGQQLKELLGYDFKEIETSAVKSIKKDFKGVISTGGSVIYSEDAMIYLKSMGTIIYLQVQFEEIESRIHNFNDRGIVIKHGMSFEDLYNERCPLYEKWADEIIVNNNIENTLFKIRNKIGR